MFFVEDRIHDTSKKIIEIVREICKKNNYNFSSDYVEYKSIGQLCEYSDYFNLYVFIDKLDYYLKFKSKVHNNLIYSSYGKMSLYMDDRDLKDELSQMDKFVFDNNINLDLIKEVPVQEAVERINKNLDNYCVVIFTKDTKKAYYFIENVKAKQIFVNKNPYMNYKFDIDEEKLVIRKRIYI